LRGEGIAISEIADRVKISENPVKIDLENRSIMSRQYNSKALRKA
jgi:DNA-binding CsgD family transcriptional regulator